MSETPSPLSPQDSSTSLGPTLGSERIEAIDVLRGVAVLGILAMNIYAYAMPFAAYANPLLYGGEKGLDLATWFFTHLFFDQKFMPIFSMLFGAGVVILDERARQRGAKLAGIYYRRTFWLLLFGLVHAYLIWTGDILVMYATLGFVIYLFRRRSARTLLVIGTLVLLVGIPANFMTGSGMAQAERQAAELVARLEAGETLNDAEARDLEEWETGIRTFLHPTPEDVAKDIEVHRGGYAGIVRHRAPGVAMIQTMGFLFFGLWRGGGMMLIGMGLMKLGVFSAHRSSRFYRVLLAAGYGIGLPLAGWTALDLERHAFDGIHMMTRLTWAYWIGGTAVALGHVALVMLAVRHGWLAALQTRLAATGRMALTNYLAHSILLTPLFYGYGLGLYGRFDRFTQIFIAGGVWILQLWWSPLWLRRFRFGPLEWLWRSLTYWRRQPMRRT